MTHNLLELCNSDLIDYMLMNYLHYYEAEPCSDQENKYYERYWDARNELRRRGIE